MRFGVSGGGLIQIAVCGVLRCECVLQFGSGQGWWWQEALHGFAAVQVFCK